MEAQELVRRSSPNRPNWCCWRSVSRLWDKISAPHSLPCTLHRLRHAPMLLHAEQLVAAATQHLCPVVVAVSIVFSATVFFNLAIFSLNFLLAQLSGRMWASCFNLAIFALNFLGRMRASCRWSKAAAPPNRGSRSSACCLCIEISPSSQDISVWTVLALAMSFNIAHWWAVAACAVESVSYALTAHRDRVGRLSSRCPTPRPRTLAVLAVSSLRRPLSRPRSAHAGRKLAASVSLSTALLSRRPPPRPCTLPALGARAASSPRHSPRWSPHSLRSLAALIDRRTALVLHTLVALAESTSRHPLCQQLSAHTRPRWPQALCVGRLFVMPPSTWVVLDASSPTALCSCLRPLMAVVSRVLCRAAAAARCTEELRRPALSSCAVPVLLCLAVRRRMLLFPSLLLLNSRTWCCFCFVWIRALGSVLDAHDETKVTSWLDERKSLNPRCMRRGSSPVIYHVLWVLVVVFDLRL